jgi:deoxyribonuclease V
MKPQIITHSWSLSEEQALKLQHELATKVIIPKNNRS